MQTACRKCGSSPTVKAHIFPQAVLKGIRSRGPDTKIIAVRHDRAMTARNQNGIYDSWILCKSCDAKIGKLDKWFIENIEALHKAAESVGPYEPVLVPVDPEKVIRFAVSIVYRASLSALDHFSNISLGPYTGIAGLLAIEGNAMGNAPPLVMLNVLTSATLDTKQFVFYPVHCSGSNGRYFVSVISGIQFIVKFGGRQSGLTDDEGNGFSEKLKLKLNEPVFAVAYPFEESAEAEFLSGRRPKR